MTDTTSMSPLNIEDFIDKSLLIVDDDKPFAERLKRAMDKRGYESTVVHSIESAIEHIDTSCPSFAVIDMRLGDGNGIEVIKHIGKTNPSSRAIMLTGYGNIATAVSAIKNGAFDYLAKPADADQIHRLLMATPDGLNVEAPEHPMTADRVRWEHIQRVFEMCGRNVSKTAERLNMHRRTLQRILNKRAPN